MEAFLKNVPAQVNANVLTKHLQPHMHSLSIEAYSCDKAPSKTFATVTFLLKEDCLRFLQKHGQVLFPGPGRSKISSNAVQIFVLGTPIYCSPNNRPLDPFSIRNLESDLKQKTAESKKIIVQRDMNAQDDEGQSFPVALIACGAWTYQGTELVFMSHLTFPWMGTVRFGLRSLNFEATLGQRIEINYSAVQHITASDLPSSSMTFAMREAPRFSEKNPLADMMAQLNLSQGVRGYKTDPIRVTSFGPQHQALVADCWVYRFYLEVPKFRERLNRIKSSPGFPTVGYHRTRACDPTSSEKWNNQWTRLRKSLSETYHNLPYPVLFQVQRLAQNGYLTPSRTSDLLTQVSSMVTRSGTHVTAFALKKLATAMPWPGPEVESSEFEYKTLIGYLEEYEEVAKREEDWVTAKRKSENVAIIHRATVTPAGIYLSGPKAENKNRVLRKYPNHHDHFLRVTFTDEDNDPVRFDGRLDQTNIFRSRFKSVLEDGILIAGRKFAFLGFSHSSLRAQTCWFMAPFVYNGEFHFDRLVINRLGDFKHIRSPAKCAARIGQAFSETPNVIPLEQTQIITISDVQRGEHVFSDGCGSFSQAVLDKIWDSLPKKRPVKPFCFQIRHSGAKGMLSFDPRLQGDVMCLRPSMIKFPGAAADAGVVELCGAAYKPLPMYLNRQTIKIMEDLGVDGNWFLKLQKIVVDNLRSSTVSAENAANFLRSNRVGEVALISRLIRKFGVYNWSFHKDEFLVSVVETAVLVELRALKYRTRILVEKGATLYGIMDETGTLAEGEVFITMDTDTYTQKVVTGDRLVITRAPALHPGDVRLVKGVSLPYNHPLMQLRNCVVFSQKGERDLPSMLSGGDLDGDLYNIIWDEEAVPRVIYSPAEYARATAVDIGREVKREDMTSFFFFFMETDQLGRIATLHQVLADQRPQGTVDVDCILLASMHSTAVDFSKTGIPVDISRMPKYSRFRPDFMAPGPQVTIFKKEILFAEDNSSAAAALDQDGGTFKYYESDKILGKLYRAIDEPAVFRDIQQNSGGRRSSQVMERAWIYAQGRARGFQWEHLKSWARDIREMYEGCVLAIIANFSTNDLHPITEIEVVVGNILGAKGAQNKKQRELSTSMKEEYDRDVTFTINSITKDGADKSNEAMERSLACFCIAFEESRVRNRGEKLRSFLYVAASVCLRELDG